MKIVDFGYVNRCHARQVWQVAKLVPTVVLAVILAGCLAPEKFVASVDVRSSSPRRGCAGSRGSSKGSQDENGEEAKVSFEISQ